MRLKNQYFKKAEERKKEFEEQCKDIEDKINENKKLDEQIKLTSMKKAGSLSIREIEQQEKLEEKTLQEQEEQLACIFIQCIQSS